MDRRRRLVVGLVLSVALLGLCVQYGAAYDESWPHPTGDQLAEDNGEYAGEDVLLFGEVRSTSNDIVTIRVTDGDGDVAATLEVRSADFEDDVEPGAIVQVYGELEPDETMTHNGAIDAEETVVVDRSPRATRYKYGVSAVGGLFAAGFFARHWRADLGRLWFEPRAERSSASSAAHSNEDPNAETNADTERDSEVRTRG